MPTPKGKCVPQRSHNYTAEMRAKSRGQNYDMLRIVKDYNLRGEPVSYIVLCKKANYHRVSEFIRSAQSWSMLEGYYVKESEGGIGGTRIYLKVTPVGDAFISYNEKQKEKAAKKRAIARVKLDESLVPDHI